MMQRLFTITLILALLAACSSPYRDYYRSEGTLHPELLAKHRTECLALGFKEGSEALANCRMRLAQDWKDRIDRPRFNPGPQFGIHYGIGRRW